MGALAVDAVAALLALVIAWGDAPVVLAVLLGTIVLVPDQLVLPHGHTSYLTLNHAVIVMVAVKVAWMWHRGRLSRNAFTATPLHIALALLAVAWTMVGVVLAPTSSSPVFEKIRLLNLAAMLAVFVLALALFRAIDRPWLSARVLTTALAITAVIAVVEHATGSAFTQHLFRATGQGTGSLSSFPLELRAGHVRVRSTAEFALDYAWLAVMLLPFAVAVAAHRGAVIVRAAAVGAIGLAAVAVYWTYARSAAVAVPAVVVVLAAMSRNRQLVIAAILGAVAAGIGFGVDPALRHHLSLSVDQGSYAVRFQRLPLVLAAVAHHPFTGLGFGGIETFLTAGIPVPTTDNFYLLTYASTGVIGAAALVAVLVTSLTQIGRSWLIADDGRRLLAAAAATGAVGFAVSGLFDDALFVPQPAQLAFALLALVVATTEAERGYALMPRFSLPRLVLFTGAGAALGVLAYSIAPIRDVQQRSFTVLPVQREAAWSNPSYLGNEMTLSMCTIAQHMADTQPRVRLQCRDDFTGPGDGTMRVEAPTGAQVLAMYDAIDAATAKVSYLSGYQTQLSGPPKKVRPTGWRTAPASGTTIGLAVGLIAPLPLRRRRSVGGQVTAAPAVA